jgi:E3 ubiquitin-protein ligase UHRF1
VSNPPSFLFSANRALLASLGISVPVAPVVPSAQRKSLAPASSSEAISTSSKKKARLSAPPAFDSAQTGGARRSSRHAGKDKIDYKKEIIQERWDSTVSTLTGGSGGGGRGRFVDDDDNELPDGRQRKAARLGNRTQNPKSYGHIPGVPIGTVFDSRMAASTAAVHGPTVAGIFGLEKGTEVRSSTRQGWWRRSGQALEGVGADQTAHLLALSCSLFAFIF